MNIKYFKFVDNSHITLILWSEWDNFQFYLPIIVPRRLQMPSKSIDVHGHSWRNEIFNYKNILYLGSYLLTSLLWYLESIQSDLCTETWRKFSHSDFQNILRILLIHILKVLSAVKFFSFFFSCKKHMGQTHPLEKLLSSSHQKQ